jgi:transcriptional regulator with XRE-family HTH domain
MTDTFGTRIKALRTERKMTLDQLAAATGSSKSYIWELENKNPPRPSADKLGEIARVLGVTTDYLLGRDGETQADAVDTAFFRQYRSLSPTTRERIREMTQILSKDDRDGST